MAEPHVVYHVFFLAEVEGSVSPLGVEFEMRWVWLRNQKHSFGAGTME